MEGKEKFFNDIGVDAASPLTLLISKYMDAKTMGFYTYEEFSNGFNNLRCGTVQEMRK